MRGRGCVVVSVLSWFTIAACGGGTTSGSKAPETAQGEPTTEDALANATVYDEVGGAHKCAIPKNSCPDMQEPPREFRDKCALEGFRIVQCGCDLRCSGNAMAEQLHYNAANQGKLCAKPKDSCEPPETSASFQDACSAAKGKFVVCGCEWLCSRKLKGAVPGKPPADDESEAESPSEGEAAGTE